MDVQSIIYTLSNKLDIDPMTMEKAVGTIFSVLDHESEGTSMADLFDKIPGAQALAQKFDVMAGNTGDAGGGLLGSLQGALGGVLGEKTGALINGIAQLKSCDLDMAQISQAGSALMKQAQAAAGPQIVNDILNSVPSLKGQLGLHS